MKSFLNEHWIDTLLNGYGIWIITGVLAALFVASVVLLILSSKRESKLKKELAEQNAEPEKTQPVSDTLAVSAIPAEEEKTREKTAETPVIETPQNEELQEKTQNEEKPMKKETKAAPKTTKTEKKETPKKNTYRVSYDSDRKVWVVKKDGSSRASRLADTKEEALKIAGELADNGGANLSVHKKDGKFQKQ